MFRPLTLRLARVALLVGVVIAVLAPTAAFAQTDYPTPSTPESPPSCTYPYPDPTQCADTSTSTSTSQGSSLPFTGGDAALMATVGVVVVAGGVGLIVLSRRRSTTTT